jgi:putative methyltransferase (TIGR04325 family)
MNFRSALRDLCPPAIWKLASRLRNSAGKRNPLDAITFVGDYKSWKEAEKNSTGYIAAEILARTRAGLLKVKSGEAAFERDSIAFDVMQHDFSLLAGLLRAAEADGGSLNVLDFGGALGSSYFQCREFLSVLKDFRWSVVEQSAHVACGNAEFANEQLRFYLTIDECLRVEHPNVLLLLSVVQYLPEPYPFLRDIVRREVPYIVIERTAFTRSGRDRLTVQHVPAWIYNASYPAWFLSEPAFRAAFSERYELICEYVAEEKFHPEGEDAVFKGFHFQLKSPKRPHEDLS